MIREPSTAPYPYDPQTKTITLPVAVRDEVVQLVVAGNNVAAIQRVLQLIGAGPKISKDDVDTLERIRTPRHG